LEDPLMPEKRTVARARRDARQGKAPSTQAGEFVREEIHHVREGKHGARSTKQLIAIGLSKARRAGVKLSPPKKATAGARTRKQAARDYRQGQHRRTKPSPARSRAVSRKLKREQHGAAAQRALANHAKLSARKRSRAERSKAAKRAARTRRSHHN
jgi:hypothetical protein